MRLTKRKSLPIEVLPHKFPSQSNPYQFQVVANVGMSEEINEEMPPNVLATIDSPIMLRDELVVTQMESAATESELNMLRKFDQQGSPH